MRPIAARSLKTPPSSDEGKTMAHAEGTAATVGIGGLRVAAESSAPRTYFDLTSVVLP